MDVQMIVDRAWFEFEVRCPCCGKATNYITRIIKDCKCAYMCDTCWNNMKIMESNNERD